MDAYRKAGRGGAGNFYSQDDIAAMAASSFNNKDVEAQKPAPDSDVPPSDPADEPAAGPVYGHSGRGGAGNFVNPSTAPATVASSSSVRQGGGPTGAPAPAVVHSTGTPGAGAGAGTATRPSYSGRGGAGNWTSTSEENIAVAIAEQERKRKAALDAKVFDDVKAGLRPPRRVYHMHGHKEKGKLEDV